MRLDQTITVRENANCSILIKNKKKKKVRFVVIALILSYVNAFNFLLVFPIPGKSLSILGQEYVKHLLNAGHEVTYITPFPTKKKHEKLHEVDISSNYEAFQSDPLLNINYVMENRIRNSILTLQLMGLETAIATFHHENVKKLLEDTNEHFDAVITDLYECELYAGLAALYDCPMIWSYSMGPHWQVLRLINEPTSPAYSPHYLSSNMQPFTFVQRVEELWTQFEWNFFKWWKTQPLEENHYEKIFGPLFLKRGKILPVYKNLIYNSSLIFSNSHYVSGDLPATPANFKFIGGFHIDTDTREKSLPKEIRSVFDNSEHGVIYFSMGSMWKSKDMSKSLVDSLIKMFGELKETVIWKYEEELQNLPKNVHILKWAPQTSILSHPKCSLFISHGGLLSSMEAIHFAVPIIGVPIYFDHFININRAVAKGYAIKVDLTFDLAKNLNTAIHKMLGDRKYRQKVNELSKIYHDRPLSPGKELVHWSEHVVRTGGAPHLRSPALHVPLYQKLYLDLGTVVVIALVTIYLMMKILLKNLNILKFEREGIPQSRNVKKIN